MLYVCKCVSPPLAQHRQEPLRSPWTGTVLTLVVFLLFAYVSMPLPALSTTHHLQMEQTFAQDWLDFRVPGETRTRKHVHHPSPTRGSQSIKGKSKVHPCTGTEALYRPYCP